MAGGKATILGTARGSKSMAFRQICIISTLALIMGSVAAVPAAQAQPRASQKATASTPKPSAKPAAEAVDPMRSFPRQDRDLVIFSL